jgi:hypothetical protein
VKVRLRLAIERCSMMAAGALLLAAAAPPPKAKPEPAPALPAAQVTLKVTPGSGGGPWSLRVENGGDLPVRIPGNARLLSMELTPPAATEATPVAKNKKPAGPIKCVLPDDSRPSTDDGLELVVPSKRSWSVTFDPLFYCFGARERGALVVGTSVKARFGWVTPTARAGAKAPALNPPFAVTPVGAAVGKIAPAKGIDADAFTLTEAVTANAVGSTGSSSNGGGDPDASNAVTLSVPEAMDAARGVELGTTVSLTNGTDRPITLLYRPDMLLFTVSTPAGNIPCGFPRQVAAPIRELFTTVAVKGKIDTTVLFTAICPAGTFDEPGIYRVMPRVDTRGASGRQLGLKTWEGVATGKTPLLVRVRTPRKAALPARPTLD